MVETPRATVKEHDGGPLTHFKTVGHKRGAVDVEPQSRPLHLDIHPRRILTHEPRVDAATIKPTSTPARGTDELRSVNETFIEGFGTVDLLDARAVLDEADARVV
jgi:hypothetical protein